MWWICSGFLNLRARGSRSVFVSEASSDRGGQLTQPRVCMSGHHVFVASSRDVAGRIMQLEDSVEGAIVLVWSNPGM